MPQLLPHDTNSANGPSANGPWHGNRISWASTTRVVRPILPIQLLQITMDAYHTSRHRSSPNNHQRRRASLSNVLRSLDLAFSHGLDSLEPLGSFWRHARVRAGGGACLDAAQFPGDGCIHDLPNSNRQPPDRWRIHNRRGSSRISRNPTATLTSNRLAFLQSQPMIGIAAVLEALLRE